jgi:sigma-B regulation protein RsbU (phosphoserine phosphatase)
MLRSVHVDVVPELLRLESFVSLCYARFDVNARVVEFVDCGHPRTIHFRSSTGDCAFLQGGSLPLGFTPEPQYESSTQPFAAGDIFLFYSDGITEARDRDGEFFGEDRLAAVVAQHASRSPQEILDEIEQAVFRFAETDHLADDFTCLIVAIQSDLPVAILRSDWPSDLEHGEGIRAWVVENARRIYGSPVDDMAYWALEIATAETFTNIVEHAYEGDTSRVVRVHLQFYPERAVIRFIHWGRSFEPEKVAPPAFDGSRDGGFGLYLIQHTMDHVQYEHDNTSGHIITMEKRFPAIGEDK